MAHTLFIVALGILCFFAIIAVISIVGDMIAWSWKNAGGLVLVGVALLYLWGYSEKTDEDIKQYQRIEGSDF